MIEPLSPIVNGTPVALRDMHRAINELIAAENARHILLVMSQEDRVRIIQGWRNAGIIP